MLIKPAKRRDAFSLIEVVISSALLGVVFLGMISLQSFALSGRMKKWRQQVVFSQTAYSIKAISSSLMNASYITRPAVGETGAKLLVGYYNTNPLDKTSKLVEKDPQSYFIYCVNGEGNKLYRYTGYSPIALTFFAFNCGQPAEGNQTMELLVDASGGKLAFEWAFSISDRAPNIVHLDYRVSSDKEEIAGRADMQLQQSL